MIEINLSDRTALVTGAAGGLGEEMARGLARARAAVIVNYHRNAAGAKEVAAEIQAKDGRAMTHQADVSEPDSVSAMAAAHWGRIVNIGSVALNRPFPGSTAYVAAKGAMLGVTRGRAAELGKEGISVNMIAPGRIPVARHATAPREALERLERVARILNNWSRQVLNIVLASCSKPGNRLDSY